MNSTKPASNTNPKELVESSVSNTNPKESSMNNTNTKVIQNVYKTETKIDKIVARTKKGKERSLTLIGSYPNLGLIDLYGSLHNKSDNEIIPLKLQLMRNRNGDLLTLRELVRYIEQGIVDNNKAGFSSIDILKQWKDSSFNITSKPSDYIKGLGTRSHIKRKKGVSNLVVNIVRYYIDTPLMKVIQDIKDTYGVRVETIYWPDDEEKQKASKLHAEIYETTLQRERTEKMMSLIYRVMEIKKTSDKEKGLTVKAIWDLVTSLVPGYQPDRHITITKEIAKLYRKQIRGIRKGMGNKHLPTLNQAIERMVADQDIKEEDINTENTSNTNEQYIKTNNSSFTNEQYINEQYINEQYINEQYINEQYINEQYINEQYINEQYINEQYINEQYINEQYIKVSDRSPKYNNPPSTPLDPKSPPSNPLTFDNNPESLSNNSNTSNTPDLYNSANTAPSLTDIEAPSDTSLISYLIDKAAKIFSTQYPLSCHAYNEAFATNLLAYEPIDIIDERQLDVMYREGFLPSEYKICSPNSPRVYSKDVDNLFYCRKELRLQAMEGLGFIDMDIENCHAHIALSLWEEDLPLLSKFMEDGSLWKSYEEEFNKEGVKFYKSLIKAMHHATFLGGCDPAYRKALNRYNLQHPKEKINDKEFRSILKVFKHCPVYKELKSLFHKIGEELHNKTITLMTGERFDVKALRRYKDTAEPSGYRVDYGNVPTVISAMLQAVEITIMSYIICRANEYFIPVLWQHDGFTIKALYEDSVEKIRIALEEISMALLNKKLKMSVVQL